MALRGKILKSVADSLQAGNRKVTVIGAGKVGMALVACLLTQKVTNEVCIVDQNAKKIEGEMKDFQHAANLINHARLSYSTDFAISKCSALGVVTAGAPRKPGESRNDLIKNNATIVKGLVNNFVEHNPNAVIILVTNPVDVMTYLAWKETKFPNNRILGSGTTIDTNRLRLFIAERLGIAPGAVKGAIIGEHGDHAVPCWSGFCIGGQNVRDLYPEFGEKDDCDKWFELHQGTIKAAAEVIKQKGGTWWAIALAVSHICRLILDNTHHVTPVTTNVKGMHGIEDDVFLSLPCVLGLNGVQNIVNQNLSKQEKELFQKAAKAMLENQKAVDCI